MVFLDVCARWVSLSPFFCAIKVGEGKLRNKEEAKNIRASCGNAALTKGKKKIIAFLGRSDGS